jgi:chromosome segregation ATPase
LQISELQEKSAYFEQLSQSLERELKEQNQLKEQDSLRIINLLGEIENYKNELQNMDRFYQNKCAQLEQEKERIGYELSAELRSKESDLSHLKAYIESSKQASGSLDQLKQEKEAEIYRLKKENSSLELLLAQVKSQAESAGRDNEAKASQLATLSSSLSNLEADHLILSNKLDQWQLLSQQMTEKCNILCS